MCGTKVCEEQKQNMEDTMPELLKDCRQKELYCMHNDVEDLIESALNSKLLSNFKVIHNKSSISLNNTSQISLIIANTPDLPTEEPDNSISKGDEHLSTIPETESDKVIKFSVENLDSIPSESEDFSDNESECDVPVCDDFTTFSNPLFDSDDDFSSSDDESFSDEDVPKEIFKIYLNPLFDNEIISSKIYSHYINAESNLIESLLIRDTLIDFSPKFDYLLEEFSGELAHINPIPSGIEEADFDLEEQIRLVENLLYDNSSPRQPEELNADIDATIESFSPSPIPVKDSDSHMEEIDLFLATDDLMPPGIEYDDYDSKRDIHFLEELLRDDPLPLPENESSNFDHHDDPSFPRPPSKPPDVEVFFDFEPDTGVLTTKVVKGISEHYVLMPNILPTQPTLCPNIDPLLPFSSKKRVQSVQTCKVSLIAALNSFKVTITLQAKVVDSTLGNNKWYQSLLRSFDQKKNNTQVQQSLLSWPSQAQVQKMSSPYPAQVYSPLKKDLYWTGLPEFVDDTVTDYSRPTPSINASKCNTSDLQSSNFSVSEHGESSGSIMSKPMIKFVIAADCPRVIKTNNTENARKSIVKYAEMYRNNSKSPKVRGKNWPKGNYAHKKVTPRAILLKTGTSPIAVSRPNMNVAQPKMTSFAKTAHSNVKRPFQGNHQLELNLEFQGFPMLLKNFPLLTQNFPLLSQLLLLIWETKEKLLRPQLVGFGDLNKTLLRKGNPQNNIDDKGYWDSGCSWHMNRNISYLSEYEPYDGGYVSFGHKGCQFLGRSFGPLLGLKQRIKKQRFSLQSMDKGSANPTESHHTPSPQEQHSPHYDSPPPSHPTTTSEPIPQAPTKPLTLRRYTRRAIRIAQSKALYPAADEPASLSRDDRQGEAFPNVSSLDAGQAKESINKTSALPHKLSPRPARQQSHIAAKIKDQDLEKSRLKARVKSLEDKDRISAEPTQEDAPITGGIMEIKEELGADKSTELGSNDTEEMVSVLSLMDAVNILSSGGAPARFSTADVLPTVGVPTVSGGFPTASAIFTTASVVTPYTRRPRGITIGSSQPMRSPIIRAKDKGKEKVVESEVPKKRKLQEQIDAQVAREMEEEFARENQRVSEQLARDSEIARLYAEEELKMMIKGLDRSNEVIGKHLREYEQAEADLSIGEKLELISDLVKYQDHRAKILKGMTLEQIKEKSIPVWKQLEDFVLMSSKEEGERVKRQGLKIDQGSSKRMKTSEDVSEEDLKGMMQLVPLEEVYVEALQVKPHIIDWEIHSEGKREYWKIIRLGGHTAVYHIRQAIKDKEKELWVELKRLFEPDFEDQLWIHNQAFMHDPLDWKLYDTCGVHHVSTKDQEIFMLVERDYPLRRGLATVMISNRLQVEQYSQMANDLILKIHNIANSPR
nr:hypothetical protein [Tanacetum cinerariifolium]